MTELRDIDFHGLIVSNRLDIDNELKFEIDFDGFVYLTVEQIEQLIEHLNNVINGRS
jgi:hypothetical protein